ncbi:MAG TPA: DUF2299 family protein [Pyrinomonadaceae bacterium]|nr:DUF2299 family protein [Pyrinomonadaceae bacterium]
MSKRFRKVMALMAGIIVWLAGAFPQNGLDLMVDLFRAAQIHPLRAICVAIGMLLVIYALWDSILGMFGIQTRKHVEANVREWLDAFRFSVKREQNENAHFEFIATPEMGGSLVIGNYKHQLDRYIIVHGRVALSDTDKRMFDGLSREEQTALAGSLSIYLSRSRASFKIDLNTNEINIQRRVPITNELTEHVLVTAIEDFVNARLGTVNALIMMLTAARGEQKVPSTHPPHISAAKQIQPQQESNQQKN